MSARAAQRLRAWLWFLGGFAFILATLDLAFDASSFLRARGYLGSTVQRLFVAAAAGVGYLFVVGAGLRTLRPYLRALPALAAFVVAAATLRHSPAERFHFIEYGVLYLLSLRAVAVDARPAVAYPAALACTVAAGLLDEWVQGTSQRRYFDLRDVEMNAIAAALAGCVYLLLLKGELHRLRFAGLTART